MPAPVIRIAAALIFDDNGRVLLVRKAGTAAFMLPGGKIEPGETPTLALARELQEEIAVQVVSADWIGRFAAPAANEPGHIVDAELFRVALAGTPRPAAEIEALCWLDPADAGDVVLAPLAEAHVLPLARTAMPR